MIKPGDWIVYRQDLRVGVGQVKTLLGRSYVTTTDHRSVDRQEILSVHATEREAKAAAIAAFLNDHPEVLDEDWDEGEE